jgi:hypothetical protein
LLSLTKPKGLLSHACLRDHVQTNEGLSLDNFQRNIFSAICVDSSVMFIDRYSHVHTYRLDFLTRITTYLAARYGVCLEPCHDQ